MASEWPSFFMHIAAGPGRAFSAVPFIVEDAGQTCRYNLRLLQAGEFVTREIVSVSGLPESASPVEQRRYVLEKLEAWLQAGPSEAELLALRVQAGKLPLTRLQAAAQCGYGPAVGALARCQAPELAAAEPTYNPGLQLLRRLAACDAKFATVALCAMLLDLYDRVPESHKADELAVVLAALAAWQAQPDETGVQAATAALGLLPPVQAGRWRPPIYPALEQAVEALSPPHKIDALAGSLRHALDWASSTDLPQRFGALETLLLPAAYAAVLATCLGYPARLPEVAIPAAERYQIITQTRDHGDVYELEQDTTYYVVDRRNGKSVMSFTSSDFSTYNGTWEHQSSSGVSSVGLADDGRHVRVREAGQERLIPIPGAEEPVAPPKPPEPATGTKRSRRRRRKAEAASRQSGPECPRCGHTDTTTCTETELLEGSLEYYYLVHTEVRYHYHCAGCETDWSEDAYL